MALGSSWPSSPSTTHFQLHVIAVLCLARCLCGHEVQQFREFIWWEKQTLHPPPCSLFGCGGSFASTAQKLQSWHWSTTWGIAVCTCHCSLEAQVSAQLSQNQPRAWNAFSAFACRDQRSVSISVIYLSQLYSILFFQYNILGDEHTLKMEKQDVLSKTCLTKACQAI